MITALPVVLVLYALAPNLALGAVGIFLVGFVYLGCLSGFMTIAQLRAPAELRGRVMSALMVLLGLLYPLGSIAQGAIADEIGLRATTAGAAVVLAVAFFALGRSDLASTASCVIPRPLRLISLRAPRLPPRPHRAEHGDTVTA